MAKNENKGKEEKQERAPVRPPVHRPVQSKINFDAWWAMMSKKLPPQHYKEIVKADFMAQGLTMFETIATFNAALAKYGVKLS
jgi:hypothetical protein